MRMTQGSVAAMERYPDVELSSGRSERVQIKNGQGSFRPASRTLAAVLVALLNIPDLS